MTSKVKTTKKKKIEPTSTEKKIEILQRRITFYLTALMGQGMAMITIIGVIEESPAKNWLFNMIRSSQFLLFIVAFELILLLWIMSSSLIYFKRIEDLDGVNRKEDYLKISPMLRLRAIFGFIRDKDK